MKSSFLYPKRTAYIINAYQCPNTLSHNTIARLNVKETVRWPTYFSSITNIILVIYCVQIIKRLPLDGDIVMHAVLIGSAYPQLNRCGIHSPNNGYPVVVLHEMNTLLTFRTGHVYGQCHDHFLNDRWWTVEGHNCVDRIEYILLFDGILNVVP